MVLNDLNRFTDNLLTFEFHEIKNNKLEIVGH